MFAQASAADACGGGGSAAGVGQDLAGEQQLVLPVIIDLVRPVEFVPNFDFDSSITIGKLIKLFLDYKNEILIGE